KCFTPWSDRTPNTNPRASSTRLSIAAAISSAGGRPCCLPGSALRLATQLFHWRCWLLWSLQGWDTCTTRLQESGTNCNRLIFYRHFAHLQALQRKALLAWQRPHQIQPYSIDAAVLAEQS